MATVTANTVGIDWSKVLRKTIRFSWATAVLIVKVSFIFLTLLASIVFVARARHEEDGARHSDHRVSDQSFDRDSPMNQFAPYE